MISTRSRRDGSAASAGDLEADTYPPPIESRDHLAESGPVATAGSTMPIELDSWDRDWLSRAHTTAEYQRMVKELLERCAEYARQIDELKAARAPVVRSSCDYPLCGDMEGRCARLFGGGCSGPRDGGR